MIENSQTKLREAQFFYRGLVEESKPRIVANEPEAFGFYLSAFISAGRSVSWVLKHEETEKYGSWLPAWEATLSRDERELLQNMNRQRIAIVKRKGAETKPEFVSVPIAELRQESYGPPAYGLHVFGPPGMEPPSLQWKDYKFEFSGEKISVIEVCKQYLEYLERLVQGFIRDNEPRS